MSTLSPKEKALLLDCLYGAGISVVRIIADLQARPGIRSADVEALVVRRICKLARKIKAAERIELN